jgi:hypothetical protein
LTAVIPLNYAVQFDNALKRESVGTKRKTNTSIAKYKGTAENQISIFDLKSTLLDLLIFILLSYGQNPKFPMKFE